MYPQNVATMSGLVESTYAIGLLAGPSFGGVLEEAGGFSLPFYVIGGLTLAMGVLATFTIPKAKGASKDSTNRVKASIILQFMKLPFFWVSGFIQMAAAITHGFLTDVLEQHLAVFGLSSTQLGLVFAVNGLAYLIAASIISRVADKYGGQRYICLVGVTLVAVSYLLFGPAPFIPLDNQLWLVILALAIHGVGWGFELIGSISGMIVEVMEHNGSGDLGTVGMVSGIFNALFNLGYFIGPTMAGPLYDAFGFPKASMSVFGIHIAVLASLIVMLIYEQFQRTKKKKSELLSE
jgi:predicted MFS family arabinose efflux permease